MIQAVITQRIIGEQRNADPRITACLSAAARRRGLDATRTRSQSDGPDTHLQPRNRPGKYSLSNTKRSKGEMLAGVFNSTAGPAWRGKVQTQQAGGSTFSSRAAARVRPRPDRSPSSAEEESRNQSQEEGKKQSRNSEGSFPDSKAEV